MESGLADLQNSLKRIITLFESIPWEMNYENLEVDEAIDDLELLRTLPSAMLENIYNVLPILLDKKLAKDMESMCISMLNFSDLAAENYNEEEEGTRDFYGYATNTMHKAKTFMPELRNLRSRLNHFLHEDELVSSIDKIIELVGHKHVSELYDILRSDEVQDLTAMLIVHSSKNKLLDSNSLVWLYWGECDDMKLRLCCEAESDSFDHLGESLCAELRILREKARLLSNEKERPDSRATKNGLTYAEILESIHIAATSPEFDLEILSQTEMAFADAAVVKYLIGRFGAQDDEFVKWPRDFDECHEAFDLWKEKIKECRTGQTKTSMDDDKTIEKSPQLSDVPEKEGEALGTNTLTGEKLAVKAGYPYNSNFKSTLSSLHKRAILGNKSPGYFVQPQYHFLLTKSD